METDDPSPLRRSSRARHQPKSGYDQVLEAMAEKKLAKKVEEDESSDDSGNEEIMRMTNDEDDNDSSVGDYDKDEQALEEKKPTKRKKTAKKSNSKKQRSIQVKIGGSAKKRKKAGTAPRGRRNVHAALTALSKKVLDESETPETSLVAALLASSKAIPGIPSVGSSKSRSASSGTSIYTPQLNAIGRNLLKQHEPNSMHIALLNLLFRSVGGSVETSMKPDLDLEEMEDNEWDTLVTDVVEVMRETDADRTLLCANPEEKIGFQEYRAMYKEFWYRLGNVLLTHSPQPGSVNADSDESDVEVEKPQPFSSNRFQVEMVRDLVSRIAELVQVGQPDLRFGATVAIWELALACMERSVELEEKLQVATRQYKASAGQSRKLQALKQSMDSWRRHKAELEEIVQTAVFQGVFIHRYRDSNMYIRICSIEFLSKLTLLRPDLFLENKYLKYFGWMASDKEPEVRVVALQAFLAPFHHTKRNTSNKKSSLQINVADMKTVCVKFLNRIVDCTEDSQSLHVQEAAMELLLIMLREEFLDDWDDDDGWDQVNLKAIDKNTSPKVRKDALYFVLDQMDCFDTEEDGGDGKSTMSHGLGEKKQVERIESIASWIANKLVDGPIEVNLVRVELADHVIKSLRDMSEHRYLAVNWSAMLKAIRSENPQQGRNTGREEAVKQRVLLRMFAYAAKEEVGLHSEPENKAVSMKRKVDSSNRRPAEALSLALLKSLPQLLTAFKGDLVALQSLTELPQYLMPAVFSLPARKSDFLALVKTMTRMILESTDEVVLKNVTNALFVLADGDHVRVADVKMQLKRLSTSLQDRLMELLRESDPQNGKSKPSPRSSRRSGRRSDASTSSRSTGGTVSPEVDLENAITLCLQRWRILLKKCPLAFLVEESDNSDEDTEVVGFYNTISEAMAKRLIDRKPLSDRDEGSEAEGRSVATVWKNAEADIHEEVANSVNDALQVLLSILSWKVLEALESGLEVDDGEDLVVLRMRERLVNLVGLCYDQFIDESDGVVYSDEHVDFSNLVQASASRIASDIRTLFPRDWIGASDSLRKVLALVTDSQLIGGAARFLQQREDELIQHLDEDEENAPHDAALIDLVLPLARSLTANWNDGNRKEAGIVLSYISGYSKETGQTVLDLARFLKKINPVRFLEAQMACLRMSFNKWVDSEPELSDTPSETEMIDFEKAEKRHADLFQSIEQQAHKLSRSLGVGRLSDVSLSRALSSFMEEGVRFAFEGNGKEEDDLVLGSRLPFLLVLSKYSTWAKKNKVALQDLQEYLRSKEAVMRSHPEFSEVHEDDLDALRSFKDSLGIKTSSHSAGYHFEQDEQQGSIATPSPRASSASSSRRRISTASSQLSRMSTQSNLSPLAEEEAAESDGRGSPSPMKRRKLASSSSMASGSVSASVAQKKIDEEGELDSDVQATED